MSMTYEEILIEARKLKPEEKDKLITELNKPIGEPFSDWIARAREIDFPKEDLAEIAEAVKDFDRIDWDEWDLFSRVI